MVIKTKPITPAEAADKLQEIFNDLHERHHDDWDWAHAQFYLAVLRTLINTEPSTTKPLSYSELTPCDLEEAKKLVLPDDLKPDDVNDIIRWWEKLFTYMSARIMRREMEIRELQEELARIRGEK